MNSKRFHAVLLVVVLLLVVSGVASVYFGRSLLATKTSELDELKVKNTALEEQERSLAEAKKEIDEYKSLRAVAESIVPQEKDQARTIREIVSIAGQTGTSISSIAFPSSSLGEKDTTDINKTQLESVPGIPGISQLELNVAIDNAITYESLVSFLDGLENNRRTSAISSITITPQEEGSERLLKANLNILVFIKS
ncbi:MAG: hypothetical protein U5L95_05065 [Candidatus Saccharibacteria bacterium]|nr:hypothetical protein [Candidatus Saccharibacteria bacterium]